MKTAMLLAFNLFVLLAYGQNTYYGIGAGNGYRGFGNAGFGAYSLDRTSGSYNTAMGYESLRYNTSGSYNTATGYESLQYNTTGWYNTATGYESLEHNTTGYYNTATGAQSLYSNTTGSYNTAVGYESLEHNSTGYYNTAMGYESLRSNTSGSYNTATGYEALEYNTTGRYNTATGYESLRSNITGRYNTAVGYQSGRSNYYGSRNIFIGHQAGYHETGSDKLYIDNSSTSNPLLYGDFSSNIFQVNGTLKTKSGGTTLTYPTADGHNGYVLTTNGNGTLSFNPPSSASETLTRLVDNGNGTITYTDENGDSTTLNLSNNETLTTLSESGNGTATYTDENGDSTTIKTYSFGSLLGHLQTGQFGNLGSPNQWIGIGQPSIPLVPGLSTTLPVYGFRSQWAGQTGIFALTGFGDTKDLSIQWGPNPNSKLRFAFLNDLNNTSNKTEVMTISSDGRVGIGTTNFPTNIHSAGNNINTTTYKLFVKGGILTEEVTTATGWADYVFDDDYRLMPLAQVEAFIDANGHLPNVPSSAEVEKQGVELGNMTRIQQEKIEELTLYIIAQQKKLDEQNGKLSAQEQKLAEQQQQLNLLNEKVAQLLEK